MNEMRTLIAALSLPGFPEWTGLLLLALVLLCAAAFLLMPFSVFGVKPRLEALEVQLDEIQHEIRSLALRLQDPAMTRRPASVSDDWAEPPALAARPPAGRDAAPRIVPPVPPPAAYPDGRARGPARAEPKLDWPRQR
ncbi:hypothetical protein CR162_11000 [Pseudoroseomonas rhizosphaerae]|uniref:Uncharacterized protein n=1 Tax=Teichococcus rhizosphaerae TaxID=1335062 RepID=A0A2C7ACZ3_9PROT|nr:hypothetical protein [Pseudoroseomonas rhizosphaerae]PHK94954.1 hypothetical protein CR162_11000 [Pseudoroseomonas rhizosphaerae]